MASKITKGILISCWIVYLAILGAVVMVFMAIANGSIGYMPPVEQLENPIDKYASQVVSADGKTLGIYAHSQDNRIMVYYNDLSPDLVKALIATEDVRFAEHSGIDVQGLFRAVVKRGILMQKSGGGGSTITQQLAKQLFSPSVDNVMERLFQKPIEWVIAVQLERYYTKEEIINMYLNKFDFLYNAVGIQSAARVYFGKTPKTLKIEEAATLVGMCKNPSYFNPRRHNERTRGRRNTVLEQMQKAGYITQAECDSLKALPLTLHFSRMDHKEGLAPYFREYLRLFLTAKKPERKNYRGWQMQQFKEDSVAWETNPAYGWCNKNKKADGEFYNLYTDGLKIYTTILDLPDSNIDEVLKIVRLDRQGNKKTSQFSLGMKQRLGLAVAFVSNPDLIILDEPVNGLDIEGVVEVREIIKKLNAEKNVTFLISSHMAGEIEKTCNKVAVIYESELIATSTTEDALRLHPSMEDYFLSVVKDRRGEIII